MSADADPRDPRFFSTSSLPTSPTAPAPRPDERSADPARPDLPPSGGAAAAGNGAPEADPRLEPLARPPGEARPEHEPAPAPAARDASEAIRRVPVDDEDRLAFRVGVNLLVLLALAGLAWWGARALGWLGG